MREQHHLQHSQCEGRGVETVLGKERGSGQRSGMAAQWQSQPRRSGRTGPLQSLTAHCCQVIKPVSRETKMIKHTKYKCLTLLLGN